MTTNTIPGKRFVFCSPELIGDYPPVDTGRSLAQNLGRRDRSARSIVDVLRHFAGEGGLNEHHWRDQRNWR